MSHRQSRGEKANYDVITIFVRQDDTIWYDSADLATGAIDLKKKNYDIIITMACDTKQYVPIFFCVTMRFIQQWSVLNRSGMAVSHLTLYRYMDYSPNMCVFFFCVHQKKKKNMARSTIFQENLYDWPIVTVAKWLFSWPNMTILRNMWPFQHSKKATSYGTSRRKYDRIWQNVTFHLE